jgi:hypothetical protein
VSRPNFFIVGAPRCGTTAMYEYLRQHPDVYMPYRKEPVYFGQDLSKRPPYLDERAYLALFDGARGERRIGEATVWYLYSETAAQEIKAFYAEARVIIMLRDPIDMIESMHSHFLFTANEDIPDLGEAINAEPDRAQGQRIPPYAIRPEGLQYRWLGRFEPHLRRWLETFGPDQVHIILFDDLVRDPATTYRGVLEFLEIDTGFEPDFARVNENKRARSGLLQRITHSPRLARLLGTLPPRAHHALWRLLKRLNVRTEPRRAMEPGLRRQLATELRDDVQAVGRIVGRDLSGWAQAS